MFPSFVPCRTSSISLDFVSHLVCFLMDSSLLFDLRAFMLQRHIVPTMLYSVGSLAKMEPREFLQLVEFFGYAWMKLFSLHTCRNLWLNPLCLHRADFFRFHICDREEMSSLGGLPARSSGCARFCNRRSSVLSSSRLRPTLSHWPCGGQIHYEPFTEP